MESTISSQKKLAQKRRFSPTAYIAYALFAVGIWLSFKSFHLFFQTLCFLSSVCLVVGVFCCCFSTYCYPGFLKSLEVRSIAAKGGSWVLLILTQIGVLLGACSYFWFLERQTQLNPRLFSLETGTIVKILAENPYYLGFLPWMLYAVLGIGLAYATIVLRRKPFLTGIFLWKWGNEKNRLFFHNLAMGVVDLIIFGFFVFMISFIIMWLSETLGMLMGLGSLFLTPIRTVFICTLIIFALRKSNIRFIEWIAQSKGSIGTFFLIYSVVFVALFLWLNFSANFFTFGEEITDPDSVLKSVFSGDFSSISLNTRLSLLIIGWWSVWLPWMVSLVARSSLGSSVLGALFKALLVPAVVFCYLLPTKVITFDQLAVYFADPWVQLAWIGGLGLSFWLMWRRTCSMHDLYKGMMVSARPLSDRPLTKWMTHLLAWFNCYLLAWLMIGWLMTQFMVTMGALFITLVCLGFVGSWAALLFLHVASKKYKALTSV